MLKFYVRKFTNVELFVNFIFGLSVVYLHILDYLQDVLLLLIFSNYIASVLLVLTYAKDQKDFLLWSGISRILFAYVVLFEISQRDYLALFLWIFSSIYFLSMMCFGIIYLVLLYHLLK